MDDIDWKEKFPSMKRISGAPPLFLVNGCGLTIYGRRDYDKETRTYVKTYCACFVFIPILPLCSYRVADAGGGRWYFIGREPLSPLAKAFNFLLLLGVVGGCGYSAWEQHIQSPEYRAATQFADAKEKEAGGEMLNAARLYNQVASSRTSLSTEAAEKLGQILESHVGVMPVRDVIALLPLANAAPAQSKTRAQQAAVSRVTTLKDTNPADALILFDNLTTSGVMPKSQPALRETLLEKIVEKDPSDVAHASELALIFESRKELDKCIKLLTPLREKLGSSEGARILGEQYVREDKNDEAYTLLSPYAEARLAHFHDAEKAYTDALQASWNGCVAELRSGRAPEAFYMRVENLPKAEKDKQVQAFIEDRVKADPRVHALQDALAKQSSIVSVALDLGIIRLRRAQAMTDPAARKKELEAAEKLFTAVRGVAGETDEYRLFYGQVLYWLGKQDEGKKLFDQLLGSKGRSSEILASVAGILNQVGAATDARALLEEAYKKEPDAKKKFELAQSRSCMLIDLDDHIKWLQLCNPSDPETAASLNVAQGQKALREGNKASAVQFYRTGLSQYAAMIRTPASLNNGSLAAYALYETTHERTDFQKAIEMLEGAVELQPSETVLLSNLSSFLMDDAVLGAIGDAIDFKTLDLNATTDLLPALYMDEASRDACVQRLIAQPSYKKAVAILDRLVVLAPRKPEIYYALYIAHDRARDVGKLKTLLERLNDAGLDDELNAKTLESYQGKQDAIVLVENKVNRTKFEKLLASNPTDKRVLAIAGAELSSLVISADILGEKTDLNQAVSAAERAFAAEPADHARKRLIDALLNRCARDIAAADGEFKDYFAKYRRSLGTEFALAFAALKEGALPAMIAKNADMQRVLALLKEKGQLMPRRREEWEWPLFKLSDPAEAEAVKQCINNELESTSRLIAQKLIPVCASSVVSSYIASVSAGQETEGRKRLEACAKLGAPIPTAP